MRVLFITSNGFEDSELLCPMYRLQEEGAQVDIASFEWGEVKGKHGYTVSANLTLDEVEPKAFDLLYLPGGTAPEALKKEQKVLDIVRAFHREKRPIFAICHGPLILAAAGLLAGKEATCYWKVAEELRDAGAHYKDAPLVRDGLIWTSRMPQDIPVLMRELVGVLKEAH